MPSTHDPGQLLEPSNLLEPIDLTDEGAIGSIHASTRPDGPRISQSRRTRATSSPPGRKGGERWSLLKPVLVVAGALACFGAGTTVPQLQILMLSGGSRWPILQTPNERSASVDRPAKSDELKSAKPQLTPTPAQPTRVTSSPRAARRRLGRTLPSKTLRRSANPPKPNPLRPSRLSVARHHAISSLVLKTMLTASKAAL